MWRTGVAHTHIHTDFVTLNKCEEKSVDRILPYTEKEEGRKERLSVKSADIGAIYF